MRGWLNYYGRFTPAALHSLLTRINGYLVRRARKKYRRLVPFKRGRRLTRVYAPPLLRARASGSQAPNPPPVAAVVPQRDRADALRDPFQVRSLYLCFAARGPARWLA